MILAVLVSLIISIVILSFLLKKKPGERFSKKTVWRFVLFGALSLIVPLALSMVFPINPDAFSHLNPLLGGFLASLLTAALAEELIKYFFFRLAVRKNAEVRCWLDAIIAAMLVAIGFTFLEDVEFAISGDTTLLRAFLPGHILFQFLMGYYYGKARVTGKAKYHVLSLLVPILVHTLFDTFIISLKFAIGDVSVLSSITTMEEITALPNGGYMIPLVVGIIVTMLGMVIWLITALVKIGKWSKNGEKQELLAASND